MEIDSVFYTSLSLYINSLLSHKFRVLFKNIYNKIFMMTYHCT